MWFGSSADTVSRLRAGRPGFDSRQALGYILLATASRPVLGPTHPLVRWVPGVRPRGLKQPGSETDYSPASIADVNVWSYTSTSSIHLHGMVLNWAQDTPSSIPGWTFDVYLKCLQLCTEAIGIGYKEPRSSLCIVTCLRAGELGLIPCRGRDFFSSILGWRQRGPSKRWYPTATLHGVTTEKTWLEFCHIIGTCS